LNSVACVTATDCVAVGTSNFVRPDYSAYSRSLVERWDGHAWVIQPSPSPDSDYDNLASVACSTHAACMAVGDQGEGFQSLAESWNGHAWSTQSMVNRPGPHDNQPLSVACTSAANCIAVGVTSNQFGEGVTLVERWNGHAWSIQPSPNKPGAASSGIGAISCATAGDCWAVGGATIPPVDPSSRGVTLIEHWNGHTWSVVQSPDAAQRRVSSLTAVACSPSGGCVAVGSYYSQGIQPHALIEQRS
jgi:hypothetical protein